MKKYSAILFFVLTFFFFTPSTTLAASSADVQTMINNTIAPIQAAITDLQTRVLALETSIASLLSRVTTLESNAISDFNLPQAWQATASASLQSLTIKPTKNVVSLSCNWNGIILTQQVQLRGIAHLPGGANYYAVNTCDNISFFIPQTAFPSPGSTIPVDIYAFWQGKTKQTTVNVTVFP